LSTLYILLKLFVKFPQDTDHRLVSCKWCTCIFLHLAPCHFLLFRGRSK